MSMEDVTFRPSMKLVWVAYLLAFAAICAGIWAYYAFAGGQQPWLMAIPCIALIVPIKMHLARRLVTMRLHDNHLTVETGFLSRTRRTVDMAKIQDVTVSQSLGQRIFGVGDLTLESAGERSGMAMRNVDRPRKIADSIIEGSKRAANARAAIDSPPESKP
jgi:uncharacterized membrane protein YdbT with pleckstrin-like domain